MVHPLVNYLPISGRFYDSLMAFLSPSNVIEIAQDSPVFSGPFGIIIPEEILGATSFILGTLALSISRETQPLLLAFSPTMRRR